MNCRTRWLEDTEGIVCSRRGRSQRRRESGESESQGADSLTKRESGLARRSPAYRELISDLLFHLRLAACQFWRLTTVAYKMERD